MNRVQNYSSDCRIIDSDELNIIYSILVSQHTVSKIVCQHKLEWSYEPDTIVQQVEKFFDDQINLKPENEKEDLKKIKKEKLDIIKEQAEKTMFWGELTEATYTPEPSDRDNEYETKKTEINNKYNAVAIDASADTKEKKQAELDALDKDYKKGEYAPKERTVPNADNVYCFHPVAFVEQLKLIAGDGKEGKGCVCEARVRAFLRMLRDEEGVAGEKGYETLCGGESFIKDYGKNWDDHPQIKIYIKRINDYSSAAGAYQVMGYTWNNMKLYRAKYGISNFNQENQDKFAVALLKHKRDSPLSEKVIKKYGEKFRNAYGDMIKMILDNDLDKLFLTASLEWASFPDSPYGQQRADYTRNDVRNKFDKYLNEELEGKSDLYIKKGFFRDFDIKCNCQGLQEKTTKAGYDIDKAVDYINTNAEPNSINKCASYVRLAIEAGGLKSNALPRNALNYFTILKELGFTELQTNSYIKGDIVVFDAVPGHAYGHIAMWSGTQWISDFKQNNIIVNSDYENGKYSIFRWE